MERKYDAYCGLYCRSCVLFDATLNGTITEMATKMNMKVEDVECHGCKSDKVFYYCRECVLKKCAKSKNIDFCIQCDDYPCEELIKFKDNPEYPYHIEVFDSLNCFKEKGMEEWLKEQKIRWSCDNCGAVFTWYDLECKKCGNKTNGYKKVIK